MSEPDVSDLLTVAQAIQIIDRTPVTPRAVRVELQEAAGLRLAENLSADRDFPPFRKSLMDGYAVRCQDVAAGPVELTVVGEIAAGQSLGRAIGTGEAASIMTGAPLPDGADGVVPVEDVERPPGSDAVRILLATNPSRYVAARGSDCRQGQVVLRRGQALGPAQLAVAASIGAARPSVFERPHVAILGTGSELVPVHEEPGRSQIRNSNNLMLVALLARLGCRVTDLGFVRDDPAAIRDALAAGLEHEALFVTGGMSMGEYDFVPRLLVELGVQLKITKLRVKPGKPFVFGVREGSGFGVRGSGNAATGAPPSPSSLNPEPPTLNPHFVFGLPGNPVSAFVCTVRLASRLLARMAGGHVEERWLTGRLDAGLPVNGPREFYQPAVRETPPGGRSAQAEFARITPLTWKGSADLFTLATANVLLIRAENEPPLPKGTLVRVLEM